MPAPIASSPFPGDVSADALLRSVLAVSLTGFILFRPAYSEGGDTILDFTYDYLNPAAQRMLGMPQHPTESFLTRFPMAGPVGIFAFYCDAYASGQPRRQEFNFQYDGLDGYYHLAAQRQGPLLVVSFTDTNDQSRSAVEEELRASQAREQAALAEVERQRSELTRVFELAPVAIAVYQGPEHRIELANPVSCQLLNRSANELLGKPLFEALPELAGHGFEQVLASVYTTGQPVRVQEQLGTHEWEGRLDTLYWNLTFVPMRAADGRITGALSVGIEVTQQLLARQQVQTLNEELAVINEELRATNEEYQLANTTLTETQLQLQLLNQELEARVQQRTRELREQQTLLSQVLSQLPATVALFEGPTHELRFYNALFQEQAGRPLALGQPAAVVLPEFIDQGFLGVLDQVYATGAPVAQAEVSALVRQPATGELTQHYYYVRYQPVRVREQPWGVLLTGTPMTEQVVARQQADRLQAELLAAAQARVQTREAFYQVFEQTPALVAMLRGASHRYEYVNPAYQALLAGRQLVGLPVAEAVPELVAQGFGTLLDQVYQTGETYFGLELPFTPAAAAGQPARTSYYTFTYQAMREAGAVVGVSIFAYDITEQIQEREASAQQLRLITDSLPVLISYVDHEERYRFVNQAYQAWFNQHPADLLGRPVRAVVGERAYQAAKPYIDRALAGERLEFESRMPYREGFTRHIHTTYVPAERVGGAAGFYTLTFDVTEQVQARQQLLALNEELTVTNEELHQSNTQLTRTNVDLDTFVYTASHDLKAPITNIESIALALRSALPPPVQQDELVGHLLELLEKTVGRFQFTIAQLTDLSKLQLAHAGPAEPVLLAAVVEAVRLDLAPLIAAAAAQLTIEVAPALVVSFSPANLRSIVYNLLSNAVKYRAPTRPAWVRVRATRTGPQVTVTVQDNGLGLNAHQQQRLFGLFQRLHTHVEGTGVGLYITKRLVENGGGTIAVQSQVDVGTTFTLTFPA